MDQKTALFDAVETLCAGRADSPDTAALQAALDRLADAIEAGADVDEPDEDGLRPVDHLARGLDNPFSSAAASMLVECGANASESPTPMDGPPLHVACHLGNWSIAQGLLQAGVDPNLVGSSQRQRLMGATPAHAVAAGFRSQRKDAYANCLSVLIQAGGDLDKLDMKKRSPIDYAMESAAATGDRTLVDAMLDYGVDTLTNSKSALSAHSIGISMATVRPNKRKAETDLPSRMIKSHLTTMTRKVMP